MFCARLHRSSVVVGCIAALLLVLLCVPGRVYDWDPGFSSKHAHGWPFVYLRREVYIGSTIGTAPVVSKGYRESLDLLPMEGIPSLSADNWRFWESRDLLDNPRCEFSPTTLAADAALALLFLAAIVMLFEYRRCRRASLLGFSLGDVFVILTLVCCALGWFELTNSSFRREVAIRTAFEGEDSPGVLEEKCIAPDWARALVGDRWMPSFMWRTGQVDATAEIAQLPTLCNDLRALPYSTTLVLSGPILGDGHYPYARLSAIRQLDTLKVWTMPRLDDRDVQELSQLGGLKKIVLAEGQAYSNLIERLQTALPGCRIVEDDADL
jgi:hypothetical protein